MNIKCLSNEIIYDYFYDNLTAKQKKRVTKHLTHCSECQEDFFVLQGILFDPGLLEWDRLSTQETIDLIQEVDISNSPFEKQREKTFKKNLSILKNYVSHWLRELSTNFYFTPVYQRSYSSGFYSWQSCHQQSVQRMYRKNTLSRTESTNCDNMIVIFKKFKKFKTEIYFEKSHHNAVQMRMKINKAQYNIKNTFIKLVNQDSKMAIRQFKEGWAYFENLQLSSYQLILSQGKNDIGAYSFELSEAGLNEI
ncbi:hypothetical protein MHK_004932 [Candidatus Magnetomorum sp. HK-1]|nr:hypothetical protein MHK_004932 [Candidatus Magnetomorum sp. HK-1]